jgi:hypothetical protein
MVHVHFIDICTLRAWEISHEEIRTYPRLVPSQTYQYIFALATTFKHDFHVYLHEKERKTSILLASTQSPVTVRGHDKGSLESRLLIWFLSIFLHA